jgi:hypothetical protein
MKRSRSNKSSSKRNQLKKVNNVVSSNKKKNSNGETQNNKRKRRKTNHVSNDDDEPSYNLECGEVDFEDVRISGAPLIKGPINLYHGTDSDRAERILQSGVLYPPIGYHKYMLFQKYLTQILSSEPRSSYEKTIQIDDYIENLSNDQPAKELLEETRILDKLIHPKPANTYKLSDIGDDRKFENWFANHLGHYYQKSGVTFHFHLSTEKIHELDKREAVNGTAIYSNGRSFVSKLPFDLKELLTSIIITDDKFLDSSLVEKIRSLVQGVPIVKFSDAYNLQEKSRELA